LGAGALEDRFSFLVFRFSKKKQENRRQADFPAFCFLELDRFAYS